METGVKWTVLFAVCVLASALRLVEGGGDPLRTLSEADFEGAWVEVEQADGHFRALHFERDTVWLETLVSDGTDPTLVESAPVVGIQEDLFLYRFPGNDSRGAASLVLGGWSLSADRKRLLGTIYYRNLGGQIVNGVPLVFKPHAPGSDGDAHQALTP